MVSAVRQNPSSVASLIRFKYMVRRDYLPVAMISAAVIASIAVFTLLVTIIWLSFVDGSPGDDDLAYTVGHYADIFFDVFTYQVIFNTFMFFFSVSGKSDS